ncbi:MAG TPA: hypothetical protein VIN56_03710, partial [Candidatus Dormibacteraeota bacterium]
MKHLKLTAGGCGSGSANRQIRSGHAGAWRAGALLAGLLLVVAVAPTINAAGTATSSAPTCHPLSGGEWPLINDQNLDTPNANFPGTTTQDLHLMGYTLSGGDATLGEAPLEATVTMTLKAPPNKDATAHPHYATFYMVSWIIPGGVKQWAGVTFPSQDAKTLNQPDKLAISPIWEVGTYQGGFIPDGQIDPSQIKGSVNANTISITFPYGRHAGPLVEPLSSQATTFVLTTGGAPSPGRISGTAILGLDGLKPITGSPDSGAIFMSSRFGGEGGPAFCGDGALATHVPCVTDPAQETVPPAGALTCLPNKIPNYFARIEGKDRLNDSNASAVTLFADAPRRLVFEAMNMPTCDNTHPDLVAFDADSYAQVAAACLPFSASAQGPHVVDTADGLLFVTTNNSVPAQIVVIRERDLALLTTIDITKAPYGAPDQPLGMGWNDQTHELTVIANGSTVAGINTPDAGITLLDLIVTLDGDHVQASPAWPALSLLRAGCTNPGYAGLSSDNPYRETRHQGILVPCAWQRQGSDPQSDKDQIVQIALDTTDTTGKPCDPSYASKLCPHGFSATALPGRDRNGQTAWLYDSGSDRAFAKFDSTAGITVTAYDPDAYGPGKGGFLGRTALGLFDNAFSFGVDSATGRLYGLSPSSGITVMDGRVAKLEPGQQFHQFTAPTAQELLAVLPPTPKHPFTRVLVPFLSGAADAKTCSSAGGCRLLNWTALADTTALAQNPDANLVDLLTDNSPIKPGDQVFTSYTADARGYGVHSDLVAVGTGLANQGFGTGGSSLPFGAGNRDLLGAVVDGLNISNGLASGNASALRPADIGTAPTYLTCTEATSIQTCLPPPPGCAPPPGAPPDFCPAPPPPPPSCDPKTQQCPPPTGQLWPYPDVACDSSPNSPGQPDHQQGGTAGFYGTTWTQSKDAKGNVVNTPTQTSVAGSDNTAKAAVNCVTSDPIPGSASGQAQLQGFDLTSPGSPVHPGPQLPGFSIGKAYSITSVAPAIDPVAPYTDWQGPLSRASSSAQGIRIDLFDGSSLSIGYVNHMASATATGRTGGASSTNIVQLGKVVLTGPGPTPYDAPNVHEICGDPCPSIQAAIDQINGLLPTVLHVSQPQANAPWSTVQDPKAKNYGSPNGSPGGYT